MSELRRYVLVDADDNELEPEYVTYEVARAAAEEQGCALIARTYEYADSELVWTPDGGDIWPPEAAP